MVFSQLFRIAPTFLLKLSSFISLFVFYLKIFMTEKFEKKIFMTENGWNKSQNRLKTHHHISLYVFIDESPMKNGNQIKLIKICAFIFWQFSDISNMPRRRNIKFLLSETDIPSILITISTFFLLSSFMRPTAVDWILDITFHPSAGSCFF